MNERPDLRTPIAEQLLINACAEAEAKRVVCLSLGRAQCAESIAQSNPDALVIAQFLDLYHAQETEEFQLDQLANMSIQCAPDLPDEEIDLFVLPTTKGGEAELTRDWLQMGYDRLRIGGWLYTAVDNKEDKWLFHEVEKLAKGIVRRAKPRGMIYKLQKKEPLRRLRDFSAEFAFRDGENLIKLVTRPGVFSHRKLDLGARALLEAIQVEPGMNVLDIGCGSGAVGLAACLRAADVTATLIDSNARAVQCTEHNAQLNGLSDRVEVLLDADGSGVDADQFDLAVGNPPYFSNYKIADIFLHTALKGLKPGGGAAMVTKQPDWFVARMQQLFGGTPRVEEHRGYHVVFSQKPAAK